MVRFDCTVLVFSKAPVPGTVKTRLLPAVNEADAARIYKDLAERTLKTATGCFSPGWRVQLWCTPVTDHPFFLECRDKYGVELHLQARGDLGQRMRTAIRDALQESDAALLIGCDCPELQQADLETARRQLHDYDVVLGPSEDGGYYLVGMTDQHPGLFEKIPWGETVVMELTRTRLKMAGLSSYQLPLRWDLDDADGLTRYLTASNRMGEE